MSAACPGPLRSPAAYPAFVLRSRGRLASGVAPGAPDRHGGCVCVQPVLERARVLPDGRADSGSAPPVATAQATKPPLARQGGSSMEGAGAQEPQLDPLAAVSNKAALLGSPSPAKTPPASRLIATTDSPGIDSE